MAPREDPARTLCRERCAEAGEPPCFELNRLERWSPCRECLELLGEEVPEPPDPAAVIRPLL